MNLAALAFVVALAAAGAAVLAAAVSPAGYRALAVGAGTALSGMAAVLSGVAALARQSFTCAIPGLLPLSGIRLAIDPLGGLFVALIGGVAVIAGVYGIGLTQPNARMPQALVPALVAAMLLVPVADGVGTFLVCWELVAVTSLLLVVSEAAAALWYAVLGQLGFVALLTGFLVLAGHARDDSFTAVRAAQLPTGLTAVVFLLALLGFAGMAGIVPLHGWLPRVSGSAPAHGSVLIFAAMVGLGGYGLVRLGFDLLTARWWLWAVVLVLGAVSAGYAMLHASSSAELARLLGYATSANLGLVLIGIGAAGMFAVDGRRALAGLTLAAALLQVVNQAAVGALLFTSAGSAKGRWTTAGFGLGALGASVLPPGAGFVSVWLLLQGLVHGMPANGVGMATVLSLGIAAVVATSGLAVVTFVRAFGMGFLGRRPSSRTTLAGMGLAALACVPLGLAPTLVLPAVGMVAGSFTGSAGIDGVVTVRLTEVAGSLSPVLLAGALLAGAVVVISGLLALTRRGGQRRAAPVVHAGTPGASWPEVPDRIERRLHQPALAAVAVWQRAGRRLAVTGSLGYGFAVVAGLLVVLAVTR